MELVLSTPLSVPLLWFALSTGSCVLISALVSASLRPALMCSRWARQLVRLDKSCAGMDSVQRHLKTAPLKRRVHLFALTCALTAHVRVPPPIVLLLCHAGIPLLPAPPR